MNKQGENGIPYCDYTWNPVTGCLHGCDYCFAERIAKRFNGSKAFPRGFEPAYHPDRLIEPENIKKPSRIFVSDMGDLFGDWVPDEWIMKVIYTIECCPQHTFLFLTKNPKRYQKFIFPDNAWLGTSVENQAAADKRIPLLLQAPAAVRFISAEPLLGPVVLRKKAINDQEIIQATLMGHLEEYSRPVEREIDWVICGGESGPGARPMHPDWVMSLRDQCQAAGVPFFFKQWGEWFVPEDGAEACRVCGCTWNNACEDGCSWVEPGLCSNCTGKQVPNYRAVKFQRVGKKIAGRKLDDRTWDELPEIGGQKC